MAFRNPASFVARPQLTAAGAVAVLAPTLLTTAFLTIASSPVAAQVINLTAVAGGTGGFVLDGQAEQDFSGFNVASAGDVNGDGLADLIVGAPDSDPPAGAAAGRSYVVFGKIGTAGVDLAAVASGIGGFAINGQAGYDRAGRSVSSAGDVNGDGLADVIVGAYSSDPGGVQSAGRSYVVFGKTDGAAVDLSAVSIGFGGFAINGVAAYDTSGRSVASAGDVNGDGRSDIIIGAPFSTPSPGLFAAGRSYVVFGKIDGAAVNLATVATGTSTLGFLINGETSLAQSGFSVASAGDVNGDGLVDVIVGNLSNSSLGRIYVIFGKTTSSTVELSTVSSGTGSLGFLVRGEAVDDRAGFSVSGAGDVNGDGLADVIIGAPSAGIPPFIEDLGRSYVVFGRALSTPVELSQVATGASTLGFAINGEGSSDFSGRSVSAAGDVNGDGLADVIVGVPSKSPVTGGLAGASYIVFGKTGPAAVSLGGVASGTSGQGIAINGQAAGDRSGYSVSAAGDVNGDGFADVIVGAPYSAPPAGSGAGRSYIVFGTGGPTVAATYRGYVAGYAPPNPVGIGSNRFGDDKTVFPDSRLWINFEGGGGPFGLAGASWVDVTLSRSKTSPPLGGFDSFAEVANVQWYVETERSGWASGRVTVRYTNAEIAGMVEGDLVLYQATSPSGPWTALISPALDTARNEASGTLAAGQLPRYLALSTSGPDVSPPDAIITRLLPNPSTDQVAIWSVEFDEPITGTVTANEITPTGSLAPSAAVLSVTGAAPPFIVRVVAPGATVDGTLGFDLAAGSVADLFGFQLALSSAPAYTIDEPDGSAVLAGDVDKNGVVNVADVTLLSNFIVNGGPPLP